jgi:deoxyribodipyrimidine photo-lyase
MQNNHIHIIWFKRDLRLHDNAAFYHANLHALENNQYILPIYIIEPELWQQPDSSQRHFHFIHDCLQDLIRELKGGLCIKIGDASSILEELRSQYQNITLWSHEESGNGWSFNRDKMVAKWCKAHGIIWNEQPFAGVVRRLPTRDIWAKIRDERMATKQIAAPINIAPIIEFEKIAIPPKNHQMFGEAIKYSPQQGGRTEGLRVLNSFLSERGRSYMKTISKPGISARHCSRLSAHIAYGSLSVREIEQATKAKINALMQNNDADSAFFAKNLSAFLSRLAWRCHFVQKLEQQPEIEHRCMHEAFEGMREPHFRADYFTAWQTGTTGYPLIDACMRSLHENGWITFRMRAMLVSFASYHLWLDFRKTAPFMAGLFTDYEAGIHYSQFQMQSGITGINAIRMYNPIKQSLEHDPEGKFIKRFVPELRDVPPAFIHEPWRLESPPKNYPPPIVNHEAAIKHARSEIGLRWRGEGFFEQAKAVNQKLGSRKPPPAHLNKKLPKKNTNQLSFDL